MPFKRSYRIYFVHIPMIVILLVVGSLSLGWGICEYNRATFESFSSPDGIVIMGDNDTVIEDMKFIVSESHRILDYEEGWRRLIIDFNSSCKSMFLSLSLPHKVDYAFGLNKTETNFFYFNASYDDSKDRSSILLSYDSTGDTNWMYIDLDWKVCEKISYDQWRVEIAFETPYFGKPLFTHIQAVPTAAGIGWIPQINRLVIQIEGTLPLDLSYTSPQPSYYFLHSYGRTSAYWSFVSKSQEISSVQAVFEDPALSRAKSDTVFHSGLFIALGISFMVGALRETFDLLKWKARESSRGHK